LAARPIVSFGLLTALWAVAPAAHARPPGPGVVCEAWPESAACQAGVPDCTTCHTSPPGRNVFGDTVAAKLLPDAPRPLTDDAFAAALPAVLAELAADDADGDGFDNETELLAGTGPGDETSFPHAFEACDGESTNPGWDVCGYDAVYAFKKVNLDVCGRAPGWDALQAFKDLAPEARPAALDAALEHCLDSAFWMGRDGVLWRIAHAKIRPLWAVKAGDDGGPVPLADYDDDYALFTWTQTDDRDARETLTAQYYVRQVGPTRYEIAPNDQGVRQFGQPERRAGMLTTGWFFVINTMFTAVPRTTAAQAYRSYLGLDIAKSQGLIEPEGPLVDYDDKGVNAEACAACHRTLDPLAYPFSRYWGIANDYTGYYDPSRPDRFDPADGSRLGELPEAGALFGEPVADLLEWAEKGANSEYFARSTVRDYWRHFMGHDPTPAELSEFEALVAAFPVEHAWRVERMLHALIRTEAYGVP
jgi:hypothetical protein